MIMRGLWRLAKGERAGIADFGGDLDHFYASLAPLIGIPLAGALVMAMHGAWREALVGFLARLVGVLLLPLLVYEFSRLFKREKFWLRTATALNWSFWVLFPALIVAAFIGALLSQFGVAMDQAEMITLGLVGVYLLWYRLFALRAGLGLSYWRAGVILFVSSGLLAVVTVLPYLLGLGPQLKLAAS